MVSVYFLKLHGNHVPLPSQKVYIFWEGKASKLAANQREVVILQQPLSGSAADQFKTPLVTNRAFAQ